MSNGVAQTAESRAESAPPLLESEDPAPFEIVNPEGSAKVVLICDHASAAIPQTLGTLGLDETVLCRHIAWDIGAADVARRLAAQFDAPLVMAGYSRLVIDPNRELDDPTSIAVISDGVVVPENRDLSPLQIQARAEACFWPYHDAVDRTIHGFFERGIAPAVVSIHSFTPVFKGIERPWHYGILWNRDPRIAEPLIDKLRRDTSVTVGDNEPYSGRDKYGYSVETHAEAVGLPHVLVEIRQDLIDTHHGAAAEAERLGDALQACFAGDPDMFRVVRY